MPFFTRHLAKGGPEFWALLREALLDLVPRVSREEFVHSVGAQDKVLVELIANDRRDAAVDYIENWGNDARRFPTTVTPEGVRVELPLTEGLPDDVNVMSDRQLELISRVMRAVWDGDRLTVSGWAFIRNLDLAANPPEILVELVSADHRTRIPLETESFHEPRVDVMGGHWHCDYRPGGFRASIDAGRGAGRRRPGLGLRDHHDRGRPPADDAAPRGVGGRLVGGPSDPSRGPGLRRTALRGSERNYVLRVAHAPMYAVSQTVDPSGVVTSASGPTCPTLRTA